MTGTSTRSGLWTSEYGYRRHCITHITWTSNNGTYRTGSDARQIKVQSLSVHYRPDGRDEYHSLRRSTLSRFRLLPEGQVAEKYVLLAQNCLSKKIEVCLCYCALQKSKLPLQKTKTNTKTHRITDQGSGRTATPVFCEVKLRLKKSDGL